MTRFVPLLRYALAVVAVVISIAPTSLHAQADARALFRRGVTALREGRHADAERAFLASYEVDPRTATLCNLAVTYDEWPKPREAAETYERCAEADTEGRYRDHANERARALREALAAEEAERAANDTNGSNADPSEVEPVPSPFVEPTEGSNGSNADGSNGSLPIVEHTRPVEARRGHGLAIAGSIVAALGAGLAGTGAYFAGQSRDARAELDERHPGDGPVVLPDGSDDAALLEDARRDRRVALGTYAAGATLGALGVTLIVLDLVQPRGPALAATPLPGGAMVVARVTLPR
ncbi:MAG: tetratricopeptide repeat protein [Myxococcota bacterium]|jgi:tetratricopeptide (TPR) repeat protein|nr:tetratricopeptide repeat protein [Myxococcota bacterium]